jgi:DNA-binding beta-propeller fold protein YncE
MPCTARFAYARLGLGLLATHLPAALLAAQQPAPSLLVSAYATGTVLRIDATTGALLGDLGPVPGAQSARYGPDGHLYVCSETTNRVLRFDGTTLAPLGAFVADDPLTAFDETGGLAGPTGAVFGRDGDLYVASFDGDRVLRYDGQSGGFLGVHIAPGSGGLNGPDAGICFGPDGRLYVPSFYSNAVLRFDESSGAFLDAFAVASEGGLSRPRVLRFRTDGVLYVTSWGSSRVLRYDLAGQPLGTFLSVSAPTGLAFEASSGDLLITNDQVDSLRRYDGSSAALETTLIPPNTPGYDGLTFVAAHPDPELHLDRLWPGTLGSTSTLLLRNATPNGVLLLGVAAAPQSIPLHVCAELVLGVLPQFVLTLSADGSGGVQLDVPLPLNLAGQTLALQAFDPGRCALSNLVLHEF